MCSVDIRRKPEYEIKWTDDIKKDNKYFGVGTVNNQTVTSGHKIDRPCEDRHFSYELKENSIFAYGVLDGFNGVWAVDLLEKCLLANLYFDHLKNLEKKNDSEIYLLLDIEFEKAEKFLNDQIQDVFLKRASRSVLEGEYKKGTAEHLETIREIKQLDSQLNIGAFAMISLIVNDRLFITNIGPTHCFVCFYDRAQKKFSFVDYGFDAQVLDEYNRLKNAKANVDEKLDELNGFLRGTRCLGDLKAKYYYHELPYFKDCTCSPIISQAIHQLESVKIDRSFLFMAMYSDGLAKALKQIKDVNSDPSSLIIATKLIEKITSEKTLNSAAQCVLDEIKRSYDDKFSNSNSEREDFTLIVRVFDLNIKERLNDIKNEISCEASKVSFEESSIDTDLSDTFSSLELSRLKRQDRPAEEFLNQKGEVIPYLSFDELEKQLKLPQNKFIIDDFCDQLENLKN